MLIFTKTNQNAWCNVIEYSLKAALVAGSLNKHSIIYSLFTGFLLKIIQFTIRIDVEICDIF